MAESKAKPATKKAAAPRKTGTGKKATPVKAKAKPATKTIAPHMPILKATPAKGKGGSAKSLAAKPVKSGKDNAAARITPEQRYRMICDAAYYRAERRGFVGGSPKDDWIAAEAEVDKFIRSIQQ